MKTFYISIYSKEMLIYFNKYYIFSQKPNVIKYFNCEQDIHPKPVTRVNKFLYVYSVGLLNTTVT